MSKRSPNLADKPNAKAWLKSNPAGARLFELVRKTLVSRYTGKNHGYLDVDGTKFVEYRFNRGNEDHYTTVVSRKTKAVVRFNVGGKRRQFDVFQQSDITPIVAFLRATPIANFRSGVPPTTLPEDSSGKGVKRPIVSPPKLTSTDEAHPPQAPQTVEALEGIKQELKRLSRSRSKPLRDAALGESKGVCEACEVDYSCVLGGLGYRALHVHHRTQLAHAEIPTPTKLQDLAVVCATCHSLLHADPAHVMPVHQLRALWRRSSRADG